MQPDQTQGLEVLVHAFDTWAVLPLTDSTSVPVNICQYIQQQILRFLHTLIFSFAFYALIQSFPFTALD